MAVEAMPAGHRYLGCDGGYIFNFPDVQWGQVWHQPRGADLHGRWISQPFHFLHIRMLALSASAHATEYCGVSIAAPHGRVSVYTEPNIRSYKMKLLPDGALLDIENTAVPYDEEEWTPVKDNGWVETKYTQGVACASKYDYCLDHFCHSGVTATPLTNTFGPTMADAPDWLKKRYSMKPRLRRR
jgi:hypothetical protein